MRFVSLFDLHSHLFEKKWNYEMNWTGTNEPSSEEFIKTEPTNDSVNTQYNRMALHTHVLRSGGKNREKKQARLAHVEEMKTWEGEKNVGRAAAASASSIFSASAVLIPQN